MSDAQLALNLTGSKLILLVALLLLVLTAREIAAAQSEATLYTFCTLPNCADGLYPDSNLVLDAHGNLYGETVLGGANGTGTAFELTASVTEIVLHNFSGGLYAKPGGGLILDAKGNLYGTNSSFYHHQPGPYSGTVFELRGKKKFLKRLYRFAEADPANGEEPSSGLIMDAQGNLYGTTFEGGALSCNDGEGCGAVFEITATGTEKVLYGFAGGVDGDRPYGGLIMDTQGNLYGTTIYGGSSSGCQYYGSNCGTVFKLTPDGTETVLHSFAGGADGEIPDAGLVMDSQGNLYGTTTLGGGNPSCPFAYGCGTVFKLTPEGVETVIYSFAGGMDGEEPSTTLVLDAEGNLYGMTYIGGGYGCYGNEGCGTVFKLTPSGAETVLHRFAGPPTDGAFPQSALVFDAWGNLYGTTNEGGPGCGGYGCGTLFRVTQ
jgi:uncharacterized repeat protein (TIGR03803 family)